MSILRDSSVGDGRVRRLLRWTRVLVHLEHSLVQHEINAFSISLSRKGQPLLSSDVALAALRALAQSINIYSPGHPRAFTT